MSQIISSFLRMFVNSKIFKSIVEAMATEDDNSKTGWSLSDGTQVWVHKDGSVTKREVKGGTLVFLPYYESYRNDRTSICNADSVQAKAEDAISARDLGYQVNEFHIEFEEDRSQLRYGAINAYGCVVPNRHHKAQIIRPDAVDIWTKEQANKEYYLQVREQLLEAVRKGEISYDWPVDMNRQVVHGSKGFSNTPRLS